MRRRTPGSRLQSKGNRGREGESLAAQLAPSECENLCITGETGKGGVEKRGGVCKYQLTNFVKLWGETPVPRPAAFANMKWGKKMVCVWAGVQAAVFEHQILGELLVQASGQPRAAVGPQ